VSRQRQEFGEALALLARQSGHRRARFALPGVLIAIWLTLTLWCLQLAADPTEDAWHGVQLAALALTGLAAGGGMALMLVRTRSKADRIEMTARGLRTIIETAQEVIWVVDAEGTNVFLNEASREVYGYAPEELIGKASALLLDPENAERDAAALGRTLSGESVYNYETTAIRKDGSRIPILCNASALRDATGHIIGSMGTAADISKLKSMQHQLLRNERQQALGTLASGVVHDFNNLLTVILGQAERAREDEGMPEKAAHRVAAIEEAAQRARRMVERLLIFTGTATASRTRIDLAAAVLRMESFLADLLGERGSLAIVAMDATVPVTADWGQIEQIVMNLVLNARDAIDDDGRVRLRIQRDEVTKARAVQRGIERGSWARLEVSDNGKGMDRSTRERAFEPFFTTKASGHGTGLGLAGVQGIVQQHDGAIHVESEPGQGTSMTVLLPLASETVPVGT